jgi:protein-tyrosine kinase
MKRTDTAILDMASASLIPPQSELQQFTPDWRVLDANHIVAFNNRHIQSRPFSLLRSQLVKRMKARNLRIIGVTSPAPGAGKSFLSANLAATLSRLPNRSIHVFDLDVRRSSLAYYYGISGTAGLESFLAGRIDDLRQVGRAISGTNLSLYPSFLGENDTLELLAGDRFNQLVAAMRALPDDSIVICDLPPVFANDDAMMISEKIDGYLLVIEQGQTTEKQVQDCMRLLSPAQCVGSILNRYEGGIGDSYGYGYGAYGAYNDYYSNKGSGGD